MLAKVLSSAVIGIDAYKVEVEVDISQGLPGSPVFLNRRTSGRSRQREQGEGKDIHK